MATTIDLSAEIDGRLAALANRTGRTKDFFVDQILNRGLEDVADYYLASKVLERVREGEESVFSSEEVRKQLALED